MGLGQSQEISIKNKCAEPAEIVVVTNRGKGDQRVTAFTLLPDAVHKFQIDWKTKDQRYWTNITMDGATATYDIFRDTKKMSICVDESEVAG